MSSLSETRRALAQCRNDSAVAKPGGGRTIAPIHKSAHRRPPIFDEFDGILANSTVDFNAQDRLPRAKLVQIINHFGSLPLDHASVPDDLFGNAYEYLIRNFASKAGKSSGEFYTPREVAFLMSEIVEPEPGNHICDWAAGSGGLLLQCRNYVERHFGKQQADRLFFYMQESNPSTANIARINMFLHGLRSFQQAPASDNVRVPFFREGHTRRLRQFDRIVMNPPFSLDSSGYDDFVGGDPFDRLIFGMPPRDNGDCAWMQQVVKSLKPTGRAIIVIGPAGCWPRRQVLACVRFNAF